MYIGVMMRYWMPFSPIGPVNGSTDRYSMYGYQPVKGTEAYVGMQVYSNIPNFIHPYRGTNRSNSFDSISSLRPQKSL